MADSYGLPTIPLQPTPPGSPPADPLLAVLLSFLKAFLVEDQNATAAWQSMGVSPANAPVNGIFPFNPEDNEFNESALPALFLWRESGKDEWIADDYLLETTQLKLLWVFTLGNQPNQTVRNPYINGIVKVIQVAIERGRTPSWKQPGDPDPLAVTRGSWLGNFLNAWSLSVDGWRRTHVTERDLESNRVVGTHQAVELTLSCQETWTVDIEDPNFYSGTSPTNGVDAVITTSTGATAAEGYLAATPQPNQPQG